MKALALVFVALISFNAMASESSKQAQLDELLRVMDMDKLMNSMYSQLEVMMNGMSKKMGVKPSEEAIYQKYHAKTTKIFKESLSWEKMKPLVSKMYSDNFSEKEISEMLTFYKTETGQAILQKMPVVMQQSMQMGQELVQQAMPQIQAAAEEFAQELNEFREQQ